MKNILLFLILLTTFNDISFASFPVTENQQTEILELSTSKSTELQRDSLNIYALGSFLLFILALIFVLMIPIGIMTFSIGGPTIANYIYYAILSALAAIILGIIAFVKRLK